MGNVSLRRRNRVPDAGEAMVTSKGDEPGSAAVYRRKFDDNCEGNLATNLNLNYEDKPNHLLDSNRAHQSIYAFQRLLFRHA